MTTRSRGQLSWTAYVVCSRYILCLNALWMSACGREETTIQSPPQAASPEAVAQLPSPSPTLAPEPEASPEELRSLALIDEALAMMQRGRYADAQRLYQEAINLQEPPPVELLLALSWSAFGAGDLDVAQQAASRSLARAQHASQRATSLYYLGRIAERRDAAPNEPWRQASFLYHYSLLNEERNATRHRLAQHDPERLRLFDQRTRQRERDAEEVGCQREALHGPFDSFVELCDALRDDVALTYGVQAPSCRTNASRTLNHGEHRAALVELVADTSELHYLTLHEPQHGWYAQRIASVHNPDPTTTRQQLNVRQLGFEQLIPDAAPELVVELERERCAVGQQVGLSFSDRDRRRAICGRVHDRLGCVILPLEEERVTKLRGAGDADEVVLVVQGYSLKVHHSANGHIQLEAERGVIPACLKPLESPRPLAELLVTPKL
jgi:tetratricopeptide (TPR) repeat protein